MVRRTSTTVSGQIWGALHAMPAVTAGSAVLLFLTAALLPFSVFIVLVAVHLLLTLAVVLPQTRSASARSLLLCDHVSELGLLLFALAVSLSLDPAANWQAGLAGWLRMFVTVAAFLGVVLPKSQVLRMTVFSARSPLTLHQALLLMAVAIVAILCTPLLLDLSATETAVRSLERIVRIRL